MCLSLLHFGRFTIFAALVPPLAGAVHHESFFVISAHIVGHRGSKRTWKFHRWKLRHRTERKAIGAIPYTPFYDPCCGLLFTSTFTSSALRWPPKIDEWAGVSYFFYYFYPGTEIVVMTFCDPFASILVRRRGSVWARYGRVHQ